MLGHRGAPPHRVYLILGILGLHMRRQTLPTEPYAPAPRILQPVSCKHNEVPNWNDVFNKGSSYKIYSRTDLC